MHPAIMKALEGKKKSYSSEEESTEEYGAPGLNAKAAKARAADEHNKKTSVNSEPVGLKGKKEAATSAPSEKEPNVVEDPWEENEESCNEKSKEMEMDAKKSEYKLPQGKSEEEVAKEYHELLTKHFGPMQDEKLKDTAQKGNIVAAKKPAGREKSAGKTIQDKY